MAFLLCCDAVAQSDQLSSEQIKLALHDLYLNLSDQLVEKIILKFCDGENANKQEFYEICAVCLLARQLFSQWDHQEKGLIEIGLEQVIEIGMLFM